MTRMSLVNKTLPGLYNGVSQQPPTLRLENQGDIQENAYSLLVDGLVKRPNTEMIDTLPITSTADEDSFIHLINRDVNERYNVVFTKYSDNPIEVYNIDGTACSVSYEGNSGYINALTNPQEDIRCVTVADYTMVVNSKIQAEMVPVSNDVLRPPVGLIHVRRGFPETDYRVEILDMNGVVVADADYTTPAATGSNTLAKTTDIAQELYDRLYADLIDPMNPPLFEDEYPVVLVGSTIIIRHENWVDPQPDFVLKVTDSYGNQALQGIKSAVQKFTDLPPEADDGTVITITGTDESSFDNYYVKYIRNENGSGLWEETVTDRDEEGNALSHNFNQDTMPHALRRTGVNAFTFGPLDWKPRLVGNEISSPPPSFINNKINDVFFFKNRLGFLSGENIIMSRAGEYFNLFPSTATDILDGDPIDIAASSTQVALLEQAVPFNNSLLLFSDQQQFILSSGSLGLLTPTTASINPSTAFDTDAKCKPVAAGPNVYFVVPNGGYSSVREYFVLPETLTNDASDVTAHVPRYLPNNIRTLASSVAQGTLLAHSKDSPKELYVYKYFWDGDEKVQSSWSKWVFEEEILGLSVIDSTVYMFVRQENNPFARRFVKIDLTLKETGNLGFKVHLDNLVTVTGVYDEQEDETAWEAPFADSGLDFQIIDSISGLEITKTREEPPLIYASGDHSSAPCHIGHTYEMKYRFSKWYLRDEAGIANFQGRLMIRNLKLAYTDTGPFSLVVNGTPRKFSGIIMGSQEFNKPPLLTEERNFFVGTKANTANVDIISGGYLPCSIQVANFEGTWTARSRRAR